MQAPEDTIDANGDADASAASPAAAEGPPNKKQKLAPGEKKVNGLKSKLAVLVGGIAKKRDMIEKANHKALHTVLNAREKAALEGWKQKVETLVAAREKAEEDLKEAEAAMAALAAAAAAKAEKDAVTEEVARTWTEAAVVALVDTVAKFQHRLDNSSDTSDDVWQHIHAAYMRMVQAGDLASTDARSAKALKAKCVHSPNHPTPCPPHSSSHACPHLAPRTAGTTRSGKSSACGAARRSARSRTPACRRTRWRSGWASFASACAAALSNPCRARPLLLAAPAIGSSIYQTSLPQRTA